MVGDGATQRRRVRDLLLAGLLGVAVSLVVFVGGYLKLTSDDYEPTEAARTAGVVAGGIALLLVAMAVWMWWRDNGDEEHDEGGG